MQFPLCLPAWGKTGAPHLTTLLETAAIPTAASTVATATAAPAAPRKRGWLPLLTVLFLISYGLMTMLIVEQGATIESQRALLRELYRDSEELSALRMKAQQEKAVADAQRHGQSSKTQIPVTQTPSTQTQTPSTQSRRPRRQQARPRLPRRHSSIARRAGPRNRSPSSRCPPSRPLT